MKKQFCLKILILFCSISVIFFNINSYSYNDNKVNLSTISIKIKGKIYSGDTLYRLFDKQISKTYYGNNEFILNKYQKILVKIDSVLKIKKIEKGQRKIITSIYIIIKQLENKYQKIVFNTVKKIKLGESEGGKSIYGYYKGDPKKGFFGIFADLHGSYEYGTYDTAKFLLKEFKKSNKTGWFIIPTLNPDGLKYYESEGKDHSFYLDGRDNIRNVDLNRNFCTQNFILKKFNKYGNYFKTGTKGCNSEKETQTVIRTLDTYKFNKIISLHSVGGNFFIPDNSIDDTRIISLGDNLKKILKKYDFDIEYSNIHEKKQKIFDYEIDEGGNNLFTGTMETYIYEKYNIPIIIIELKKHGIIEYDLLGVLTLLKNE